MRKERGTRKSDTGRIEPWNRREPDTTDSGAASIADAAVITSEESE